MGVKIGDHIEVNTRTAEDMFGVCVYEIVGPTVEKEEQGRTKHLTQCVMLASSTGAGTVGMEVWDELSAIDRNIEEGITRVISAEEAEEFTKVED